MKISTIFKASAIMKISTIFKAFAIINIICIPLATLLSIICEYIGLKGHLIYLLLGAIISIVVQYKVYGYYINKSWNERV